MDRKKSAAILTVKDIALMTFQGRKNIVKWLKYQADMILKHPSEYSSRFTARYLYKD